MSIYLGFAEMDIVWCFWLGNPKLNISVNWAVISRGKTAAAAALQRWKIWGCWGLLGKWISPRDPTQFSCHSSFQRTQGFIPVLAPRQPVWPGWDCWGVPSPRTFPSLELWFQAQSSLSRAAAHSKLKQNREFIPETKKEKAFASTLFCCIPICLWLLIPAPRG